MKREEISSTILIICLGFMGLFLFFDNHLFIKIGFGIGVLSLLSSQIAYYITLGWYKIGQMMGTINSTIILTLVFFLVLTPVAFLAKLFSKKNKLQLKKKGTSYYKARNHLYKAADLENPF